MPDFDPLDPSIACHPILPANVPIDSVRYSTILPVEITVNGLTKAAEVPPALVMPSMFSNISVSSDSHMRTLQFAASDRATVVADWHKTPLITEKRVAAVKVPSLGMLLSTGMVEIDGEKLPLSLDTSAIEALSKLSLIHIWRCRRH
jgi:hypothetical protein